MIHFLLADISNGSVLIQKFLFIEPPFLRAHDLT